MNIPRPEHIEAQYIYRDYGGYIFKLPRNKDLVYQSIETQEFYYWTLAQLAYKQLIVETRQQSMAYNNAQVAGWELTTDSNSISTVQSTARFIEINDMKKPLRDKLISSAISSIYLTVHTTTSSSNPFQYIETIA
jgi:hypothetical protein